MVRLLNRDHVLYSRDGLARLFNEKSQSAKASVDQLRLEDFKGSTDEELLETVVAQHPASAPTLQKDDISYQGPVEIDVDGRRLSVLHFDIPFTGDAEFWSYRTSTFSSNPPRADVHSGRLRLTVAPEGASGAEVEKFVDARVAEIEKYLAYHQQDATQFNAQLRQRVASWLKDRRVQVGRDAASAEGMRFKKR